MSSQAPGGNGGRAMDGLGRVFVCEDSDEYRSLLRAVLSDAGATIVGEACDGRECLQTAPDTDPTLVLLDLNMPAMTGWEVLPWLRRKLPDPTIVILSTLSAPGLKQRALWMGADAYITNPMDAFELRNCSATDSPPEDGPRRDAVSTFHRRIVGTKIVCSDRGVTWHSRIADVILANPLIDRCALCGAN